MFIDVTRYGGLRVMRLAIGAIAYLDACEGGTSVHLLGGETLRVNEDLEEVELRTMLVADGAAAVAIPGIEAAEAGVDPAPKKPARSRKPS